MSVSINLQDPSGAELVSVVGDVVTLDLKMQPGDSIKVSTPLPAFDIRALPWVMLRLMKRIYASVRVEAASAMVSCFRDKLCPDRLSYLPAVMIPAEIREQKKQADQRTFGQAVERPRALLSVSPPEGLPMPPELHGLLSAGMFPCREYAHDRAAIAKEHSEFDPVAILGITTAALQGLDVGGRIRMAWFGWRAFA